MPVGERKEPAWRNIPVPGFVASRRDSTRQERLAKQQRKREEEENLRRRKKEQEEVMQILARKWNEEDRGSRRRQRDEDHAENDRHRAEDYDEDSRRRRKRRRGGEDGDTELDPEERYGREDRRNSSPSMEPRREVQEEPAPGGWQSVETTRGSTTDSGTGGTVTPLPTRTSAAQKRGTEHIRKIAGVFGLSDSEGEREKQSREIELAARTKHARLSARANASSSIPGRPRPAEAEPPAQAAPSPAAPASSSGGRTLTPAEVHMKYAQWKATCNRKWVPMPEDLRRAVESVMGK